MACIHYFRWSGINIIGSPPEEHCTHPDHNSLECEDCPDFLDIDVLRDEYWDRKTHEVTEG